jgi:hypothetical protein
VVYDIFALEMFLLTEVHEEKRLKEDASSVYFRDKEKESLTQGRKDANED